MLVKLFVLGRPGSGKTTAFHRIQERAEETGWSVSRIRDYEILHNMFMNDTEQKKFRAIDHNGFDVTDFSVLNDALLEVERLVKLRMLTTKGKKLLIVEFARDDYKMALEIFSADLLRDTHILFVDADLDVCMRRIHQRISHVSKPDNHFISDTIMKKYYGKDNTEDMRHLASLTAGFLPGEKRSASIIQYIENTTSLNYLYTNVDQFFDEMMRCISSAYPQELPYLIKAIDGARGAK